MEEYEKLATVAAKESAQVRIPAAPIGGSSTDRLLANLYENEKNLVLLRVVASELGRLPRGRTLADSIRLSRSPYTNALRLKLSIWRERLEKGEIGNLKEVQEEVREASAAIQGVQATKSIGRIATYLSVPLVAVGPNLGGLAGLGIGVTVVGALSQLTADVVGRRFRWVMFGSE